MVRGSGLDLPRYCPVSRTVRVSGVEPSTLEVDIVDGSMFRAGPSTLEVDIADGSILQDLTVHANAPYRGWFGVQG